MIPDRFAPVLAECAEHLLKGKTAGFGSDRFVLAPKGERSFLKGNFDPAKFANATIGLLNRTMPNALSATHRDTAHSESYEFIHHLLDILSCSPLSTGTSLEGDPAFRSRDAFKPLAYYLMRSGLSHREWWNAL